MRKTNFLKTLLVAIGLTTGVSGAWAEAGDVTTNVDIDFSNFTGATGDAAPSSVTGTKGTMSLGGAYQVLDGTDYRLGMRSGSSNVAISSTEYAGTKDVVTISFDLAFCQMASSNKSVYFYIKDASDGDIATFTLNTNSGSTGYIASLVNTLGVETDDIVVDYQVTWSHKVSFTITLNYATGKIITETACSAATNTSNTHTVNMTNTNPVAKFVVGAGYNSNYEKYRCQFDNLLIQTTEGDYASSKNITLTFVDDEDNDISALYTGQTLFTPENGATFTPSDYYPSVMYDDDYKYSYTSGGDPFTVTTDAVVKLVYTKTARPTYTVNVTANYGVNSKKIIDAVSVKEAADYTYYYPRFILDGTTLYEYNSSTDANASASYWTSTLSSVAANVDFTLTYNAIEGTCVYYSEGESITGAEEYPYGSFKKYMSGGSAGVLSSATLENLSAGVYSITGRAIGRAGDRYIDFYKGSVDDANKILRVTSQNSGNETTAQFTLTGSTDIIGNGGATNNSANGHGCDYVYIMQLPATVSVEVTDANFATYVPDYDLDFSSTSIEAYKVKVSTKGVATLTKVNQVPAGTPVLLYKEGGVTEDVPVTTGAAAVSENDLVAGTGAAVATTDGEYTNMILNKIGGVTGFYFANGQTVAKNRAYLHILTTLAPDAATPVRLVFDDDTVTSINEEVSVQGAESNAIFDLQGRRVAQPVKGLYIVNGKKVVVK